MKKDIVVKTAEINKINIVENKIEEMKKDVEKEINDLKLELQYADTEKLNEKKKPLKDKIADINKFSKGIKEVIDYVEKQIIPTKWVEAKKRMQDSSKELQAANSELKVYRDKIDGTIIQKRIDMLKENYEAKYDFEKVIKDFGIKPTVPSSDKKLKEMLENKISEIDLFYMSNKDNKVLIDFFEKSDYNVQETSKKYRNYLEQIEIQNKLSEKQEVVEEHEEEIVEDLFSEVEKDFTLEFLVRVPIDKEKEFKDMLKKIKAEIVF